MLLKYLVLFHIPCKHCLRAPTGNSGTSTSIQNLYSFQPYCYVTYWVFNVSENLCVWGLKNWTSLTSLSYNEEDQEHRDVFCRDKTSMDFEHYNIDAFYTFRMVNPLLHGIWLLAMGEQCRFRSASTSRLPDQDLQFALSFIWLFLTKRRPDGRSDGT
jgi:hypothetical protein